MTEQIPHPPMEPFFGNLRQLEKGAALQSMIKIAKYPICKLRFGPTREMILITGQELLDELCDETRFCKKLSRVLINVREFAGDGLFTAENEEPNWLAAHRILMPAFGPKAIQDMFPEMDDIAEQLCSKWERMGSTNIIDVVDNFTRLTLDTIALCAFDYRFNSFYSTDMHPFIDAMVDALVEAGAKTRRLWFAEKLSIVTKLKYAKNIKLMHETADQLIEERKKHPTQVNDLLNRMLNGRDPVTGAGLSDENIRFQLVTFLIAGHETTSGMLSFAVAELIKHPEFLRRAQKEVDDVVGTNPITIKDIPRFTFLDQVLKEALRLWPTAPAFAIKPHKDEIIGGKYKVTPEDFIVALLPTIHRDPKVWGDDAEEFNPDRMSPEKFAALPKNSWKPFGNGARGCIGRPFAWQEGLLVLAKVLQRFDLFENDPNYKLKIKESLTIKPDGFFIKIKVRDSWINRNKVVRPDTGVSTTGKHEVSKSNLSHTPSEQKSYPNGPLLILFGSNSGTCESFANTLREDAIDRGFNANLAHLNAYSGNLPVDTPILIVTASYEGQPTDDAKSFVEWLRQAPLNSMNGIKFAVVGCGHTDWVETYQRIPKLIDAQLEYTGATRLVPRGECNAAGDVVGDFDEWRDSLWSAISPTDVDQPVTKSVDAEVIRGSRDSLLRVKNLQPGTIIKNIELVKNTYDDNTSRSKRHIEIQLPNNLEYKAGDYIAVLPINPINIVNKVVSHFGLQHDDKITLHAGGNKRNCLACPMDVPVSIMELLLYYFELSLPTTKRNLAYLIEKTQDQVHQQTLQSLQTGDDKTLPSIIQLLREYKSINLTFAEYIELLVPMRIRQYSISSSPLWSPGKCSITVGVLNAPAWKGEGVKEGVASNFLANCFEGTKISVNVRASTFKLPEDCNVPIILVGAGTGLAPLRGFVQERAILAQKGVKQGPVLLFFGCRDPDSDYIYREELEQWQQQGAVQLFPVFSRKPIKDNVKYVQHEIYEQKELVADLLDQNAHVYVCGESTGMGPAVKQTFIKIYMERTQCTQEEAEMRMSLMGKRYSVDVFA